MSAGGAGSAGKLTFMSVPEDLSSARSPVHHSDGSYTDDLGVAYSAPFMRWTKLIMDGAWDEAKASRVEDASRRAQEIMRSEGYPVNLDDPSDPNRERFYETALHIHGNS